MKLETELASDPAYKERNWQDEFGLRLRFPRPPEAAIKTVLSDAREPEIFLSEGDQTVDIVVRFSTNSRIFTPEILKTFESRGLTLSSAFEDILWEKHEAEGNSFWAEFVNLNTEAFRRTWIHFFELCYLGHFNRPADGWLKKIQQDLTSLEPKAKRGRRTTSEAENRSLRKRYEAILPKCSLIHEAVLRSATSSAENEGNKDSGKIRQATWEQVRSSIHGMPGDGLIFGDTAFGRIPYQSSKSQLHDPTTWKPHQLAIAILSIERQQAYQTIEKKIKPSGKTKRTRSKLTSN
jgi:hypothetical protein